MRTKRTDYEYEIVALTNGIKVFEALETHRWEPVSVATIMERTYLPRDIVDRSLKTLRINGYAVQVDGKWTVGRRLIRISESIVKHKGF